MLQFILDQYKTHKMCEKAVDYSHALKCITNFVLKNLGSISGCPE